MHTLVDLRGNIPSFIHISDGKLHDVSILDQQIAAPSATWMLSVVTPIPWIAVSVYVLAAIVRRRLNLSRSLYELLQILSLNLFEKTSLDTPLSGNPTASESPQTVNQLSVESYGVGQEATAKPDSRRGGVVCGGAKRDGRRDLTVLTELRGGGRDGQSREAAGPSAFQPENTGSHFGRRPLISGRGDLSLRRVTTDNRRNLTMTTHSTGRHSLKLALGAVLGILLALPALAAQQFTILDYPGSTGTLVLGLNARGVAAGYTLDTPEIPFYYDLRKRLFIPIAPIPGFDATEVWNLNDKGTVVGIAHANDYSTETAFFRDADGNVTLLPHPGLTFSEAQGINDRGIVVGEAWNADFSQAVGYVYNPADHSFTDFLPSADTEVHGINRRGEIVGGVHLLAGAIYPNSPEGQYGFYRAVNGRITLFRVNESTGGTMPRAINDEGVIAGEIFTPTGAVGFVIRLEELRRAGRAPYARIAAPVLLVPGQAETYIQQVTDEGQLAGATIDADGVVHGFVSRER